MYFDSERQISPNFDLSEIQKEQTDTASLYNVILIDDDDHTYDYVIEMLCELFSHSKTTAFEMACEVDYTGRVIVHKARREEAELKKEQILCHGPDWRLERSMGSMRAIVEIANS